MQFDNALIHFSSSSAQFNRFYFLSLVIRGVTCYNIIIRQAVYPLFFSTAAAMDNSQIYDSQLQDRTQPSLLSFLYTKPSPSSTSHSLSSTRHPNSLLLPTYNFAITDYQIGQHVEYDVILIQQYRILKRIITHQYSFRTRYSMLESLDQKLGNIGLPAKKWFGNKKKAFIERRKVELEEYLKRVASCKKAEFYRFVLQIKDGSFNEELKSAFSIE